MESRSSELLAYSPHGQVERCPCCGEPVLTFHESSVTLPAAPLAEVRKQVAELHDKMCTCTGCEAWRLRIRTPHEFVVFTLTQDDAAELDGLLDAALAMLELEHILAETLGRPSQR